VSRAPLVIVGDALLDRDIDGRADRLCPDAPAPVVSESAVTTRPGGAALAAMLADRCVLIAPFGEDESSVTARSLLPPGVSLVALPLAGGLTVKTRVRAFGQTLVRVDRAGGHASGSVPEAVAAIATAGAVLVSDYGLGVTSVPSLRDALRDTRAPVVWDPHPRGAPPPPGTSVVTPNQGEALRAAGVFGGSDGAAEAADVLLSRWEIPAVAVTLGRRGALLVRDGQAPLMVPAPDVTAGDPCGAGDCFAVAVASALRDGALLSEAVTSAVSSAGRFLADGGVASYSAAATSSWPPPPASQKTLVATGGCFDLLHAGHVSMLRAARSLGDRLVVCLNSDSSVRRLKGHSRPLNPASDRAAVLSALSFVDEVRIFDEDTPERLLRELRPSFWVKGGDYDGRELPEAAALRDWGGRVVTVPYLDGRSTTRIVSAASRPR
jgi:D-beta-D-heptose 7-phosphate kinase/D-beta-D-heptose 1-phosphate adenosyltransferase